MKGFSLHQIEKMTDIKEELIFFKNQQIFLPITIKPLISILICLQKEELHRLSSTNGFLEIKRFIY
jgi:hypothetical protein